MHPHNPVKTIYSSECFMYMSHKVVSKVSLSRVLRNRNSKPTIAIWKVFLRTLVLPRLVVPGQLETSSLVPLAGLAAPAVLSRRLFLESYALFDDHQVVINLLGAWPIISVVL